MLTGYVAVNGKITTADQAKISVFDRGYLYGDGLIEVMYAHEGRVVAAELHLERLYAAAKRLCIDLPWQQELLLNELQQLARYYKSCCLRLTVSSGLGVGVARTWQEPQRTTICLPYTRPAYSIPLVLKSARRRANFANAVKTINYLESIVALATSAHAKLNTAEQQAADILWLNADGMITETTSANIFFLTTRPANDKRSWNFYTPASSGELLAGVTRDRVCQYLKQQGHQVHAEPIAYRELRSFTAAFITSSLQGIRLLQSIDGHNFATGVLRNLCESFNQLPVAATQD